MSESATKDVVKIICNRLCKLRKYKKVEKWILKIHKTNLIYRVSWTKYFLRLMVSTSFRILLLKMSNGKTISSLLSQHDSIHSCNLYINSSCCILWYFWPWLHFYNWYLEMLPTVLHRNQIVMVSLILHMKIMRNGNNYFRIKAK